MTNKHSISNNASMKYPRNSVCSISNSMFPKPSVSSCESSTSPMPTSRWAILHARKKIIQIFDRIRSSGEVFCHAVNLICLVIVVNGCSSFSSEQKQTKNDGTVVESRQRIFTFWDAHSNVSKLRASTTQQTQGLTVGALNEDTSATNAVTVIEGIVGAAVKAGVFAARAPTNSP